MSPTALLQQLRSLNIELAVCGEELRYRAPRGALTPELRQELIEHKQELLALCRYGSPAAWLYPWIKKRVWVPDGEGVLVQVFRDRAAVAFGNVVKFYRPNEVEPVRGP